MNAVYTFTSLEVVYQRMWKGFENLDPQTARDKPLALDNQHHQG